MKAEMMVSIIMNCYNGERYLREAIESVVAQSYQNWELIFWDNASVDGTRQIAEEFARDPRFKYFRADVNTDLGCARNQALKRATGAYIAFLDVDDVYLPEALAKLVNLMKTGSYGLSYGAAIIINETGREIERRGLLAQSGWVLEQNLRRYEISMVGAIVHRPVMEELGLSFNEKLSYSPDYDLFMRILAQREAGVLHEYIVKNRRSRGSLTNKLLHRVPVEVAYTLEEIEQLYPSAVLACGDAINQARAKLNFYDAINQINLGDYAAARAFLRPVIRARWEYYVIYLTLYLPWPRSWVLRALKR